MLWSLVSYHGNQIQTGIHFQYPLGWLLIDSICIEVSKRKKKNQDSQLLIIFVTMYIKLYLYLYRYRYIFYNGKLFLGKIFMYLYTPSFD